METTSLLLVAASPEAIVALIEDPASFDDVGGLRPAEGLRDLFASEEISHDWLAALREARAADPWRFGFFLVERGSRLVVGSAGFKGPPDADGITEIAYGIVRCGQGRGYATEAAAALVDYAVREGAARLVRAHTLPERNASTRVLEKCGFRLVGPVVDPDDGPVWRWEFEPSRGARDHR